MGSVGKSVGRKNPGSHDGPGSPPRVLRGLKGRQATDDCQSFLYFRWIADRGLINNHLRDRAFELAAPIRPPFLRGPLVPGDNYVTTWAGDQVANERRFQINRFHALPSLYPTKNVTKASRQFSGEASRVCT